MNNLILFGIVMIVVALVFVFLKNQPSLKDGEEEVSKKLPYEKKPYLFDANSEFALYKTLLELYGDNYFIFPQINYSHLIQPKRSDWKEESKYRSKIDRKSADFVFCDKEKIIPRLIIELDGSVHNFKSKQARDQFIDEITGMVDLPLLHITTKNLDKSFIKSEIDATLNKVI